MLENPGLLADPRLFAFTAATFGTTRVVTCSGELDLSVAPDVTRALDDAIEARPECVVLDLSELSFLDSTGIALLLGAERHAARRGVRLAIVPAPEPVHAVVRVCGLEHALPFAADRVGAAA